MRPRWALIVLSWNGRDDTLACLESLERIDRDDLTIVCVDNGSTDGSVAAVREHHPDVAVLENGANLGYAGGNNVGLRWALDQGVDWVALVNNDAVVAPDALDAFERAAATHPAAGAMSAKVFFAEPPDRIWNAGAHAWLRLGYSGRAIGYGKADGPRYQRTRPTGRAVGALMAVSRTAMEAVGLLDEDLFAYVEDLDWSVRIRDAGFEVLFVHDARAWHRVSASTGGEHATVHTLYYGTRNMIVVGERRRPLPAVLGALRRGVVVATFGAHALTLPQRRPALRAVVRGYRDARARRLGPMPAGVS